MNYLVTTKPRSIDAPVLMVDGYVPKWSFKDDDVLYDHHRPGGAKIQIDEMEGEPIAPFDAWFVTTQVDADACVAAAWLQLDEQERNSNRDKLRAIAWDCDHLYVPQELSRYTEFAAQCVAAMKADSDKLITELGLSSDRKTWREKDKELFASTAFQRGTEAIIAACKNERPFPGENGEAADYWREVEKNQAMLLAEGRISDYRGAIVINMKGLGGKYVDPRCALRAIADWAIPTPITLTQREVYIENEFKGYSYTLGCIPWHPKTPNLDYTRGTFDALSDAEKAIQPDAGNWGGRATVGGSGWNSPSNLSATEVLDIVLKPLCLS